MAVKPVNSQRVQSAYPQGVLLADFHRIAHIRLYFTHPFSSLGLLPFRNLFATPKNNNPPPSAFAWHSQALAAQNKHTTRKINVSYVLYAYFVLLVPGEGVSRRRVDGGRWLCLIPKRQ